MNNWYTFEPADDYHARSRSGEFLSSHLMDDFRRSPILYKKKISGEIEPEDSTAFLFGRAAHSLILEGLSAFDKEFMVSDGPVNEKTGKVFGKTSAVYQEWLEEQDRDVISLNMWQDIFKLNDAVDDNKEAKKLLKNGFAEAVVRAKLFDVPCQIRMDWFNPEEGLVDLKTCAELRWFEADARRFGYIRQLAFYRMVIRAAAGITVPVHIIAVEKVEPYACGVWYLTEEVLDAAELQIESILKKYKNCIENNLWPTGYEMIRILDEM